MMLRCYWFVLLCVVMSVVVYLFVFIPCVARCLVVLPCGFVFFVMCC